MVSKREIDWPAIRRAYEAGGQTLAQIANTNGVNASSITRRARAEAWPRRKARPRKSVAPAGQAATRMRPARANLLRRMRTTVERQIGEIERYQEADANGEPRNAAERERDARTLNSLVRTLERLATLQHSCDEPGEKTESEKSANAQDAASIRDELERRLAQLAGAESSPGADPKPE